MANAPGWPFDERLIPTNADERHPMIRKVPKVFRQKKSCKGCFDPMVVSIGPYHRGKLGLKDMEMVKYSVTRDFVQNSEERLRYLHDGVRQICADARRYYPEEAVSKLDANSFSMLMLVDGCFVLQFIHNFMSENHRVKHMKSNIAAFVRRDLMLLENQLPYIVLEKLMEWRFERSGYQLINNFISSFRGDLPPEPNNMDNMRPRPPLHLLDFFLSKYINKEDLERESLGEKHRHWYSYPAAKELRTLGIHFRPSAREHFTHIDFKSRLTAGLLFLPQIMIDDTTKSLLLNLVAYEASPDAPDDLCGIASYICFMDSLIDQAEDVKVLRSKGIVFNLLGSDQQAAELFNGIARDLAPKHYAFCHTRERIDSHSRSRIRTWMAEWIHTHFSSPWTLIAFVAVTATILS